MKDRPEFANATYWTEGRANGDWRGVCRVDGQRHDGRWVRSETQAIKHAIMMCWHMGAKTYEMETIGA